MRIKGRLQIVTRQLSVNLKVSVKNVTKCYEEVSKCKSESKCKHESESKCYEEVSKCDQVWKM